MHTFETANGKEILFPTSWEEVTVDQFIRLLDLNPTANEESDLIQALCDDVDFVAKDLSQDEHDQIMSVLDFLTDSFDHTKYTMPSEVTIEGVTIQLPINVKKQTIGQREAWGRLVYPEAHKNKGVISKQIRKAIAIYFQPFLTGEKFKESTLQLTEEKIGRMPITTAYPIAYFFLNEYMSWLLMKQQSLKARLRVMQKLEPALND